MALNIIMVKDGRQLTAIDGMGIEGLQKIGNGVEVRAVITVPRSLPQHKLLFGLLNVVKEAQNEPPMFPTTKALLDAIKVATGHVEEYRDIQGNTRYQPSSIDFASMGQTEFNEWFEQAIKVILEHVLPNCPKKGLEDQIYTMLKEVTPSQLER